MTAVESEYVIGPLHRHKYGLTNYYQAKKCERENFLSNTFSNNLCYSCFGYQCQYYEELDYGKEYVLL